ncbi:unnamed protein product [Cuscuta campestris]|uniref:Uncharacterized protein n=1 Tax=Cuscuta campestris TaxID=132261 RepID=A0A484MPA3_9ASTE|nr:unnamed protein product [Cuscuta campestris]
MAGKFSDPRVNGGSGWNFDLAFPTSKCSDSGGAELARTSGTFGDRLGGLPLRVVAGLECATCVTAAATGLMFGWDGIVLRPGG